jgi:eukaryotic-like serine/threonine-protein kinase
MSLPPKFVKIIPLTPGQNAKVFKAVNSFVNRPVFLKLYEIPPDDPLSALREPRLLRELEHPHVAKIFGADEAQDNQILLEMELVTGGSFKDLLDSATSTGIWSSVHDSIQLVLDTASGLSYLHSKGYVHRDVKPANLVIRNPGAHAQGVVTDLGLISKINSSKRAFSSKQSRLYRPPEAWAGQGYSISSDIYQLGIVLFQMLGGSIDYGLGNLPDDDLKDITISSRLINLDAVGPHVEEPLRRFLRMCVCPEGNRLQTMSDFVIQLNTAKLKQPDWRYTVVQDGFTMERPHGPGGTYRVTVETVGKTFTVARSKRSQSAPFRRIGSAVTVTHKDIGSCRAFRQFINQKP